MQWRDRRRAWASRLAATMVLALSACGGGGGGGSSGGDGAGQPSAPPVAAPEPGPPAPSPFRTIDLLHTQLVHDATRGKLYAYVSPDDAAHPGSLATIDPRTLAVSYSAPLGFVPFRLTVSGDGKYLYATATDVREVVRLRLPDFAEDLRIDLTAFHNPDATPLESRATEGYEVAVSPADSRTIAVSLVDREFNTTCAERLRVYHDKDALAELIPKVDQTVGNVLRFESAENLLTHCSGTMPDLVSRIRFQGGKLSVGAFEYSRGVYSGGAQVEAAGDLVMTSMGSVFKRGSLELIGGLRWLTPTGWDDFAYVMHGCTFADDVPAVAACLAKGEGIGERYFALYSLTTALPLSLVPLPDPLSYVSQVIRVGPKDFVFALKPGNPVRLQGGPNVHQALRLYFISTP